MSTRCGVSLSLLVSWGQFLASDFLLPTPCRAPGGDPHHFVVSNSSCFDVSHFSGSTSVGVMAGLGNVGAEKWGVAQYCATPHDVLANELTGECRLCFHGSCRG